MNRTAQKIKSTTGASLMLALLVFLMCAMVGSVVLASATAAAGRVKRLKEDDQTIYTLTSLAQIFEEEIDGATFTYNKADCEGTTPEKCVTPTTCLYSKLLGHLAAAVSKDHQEHMEKMSSSIPKLNDSTNADKVTIDATMDENYNLSMKFSLASKTNEIVTLHFDAVPYENISPTASPDYGRFDGSKETQIPLYVSWSNPTITVGGN